MKNRILTETIRILLIDIEIAVEQVLLAILEQRGCVIDSVKDKKSAHAMSEYNYNMIFVDYDAPEIHMNQFDLVKLIRQSEVSKEILPRPIIMVSDFQADSQIQVKCLESGINEYLIKPIFPEDVDVILQGYLGIHFSII